MINNTESKIDKEKIETQIYVFRQFIYVHKNTVIFFYMIQGYNIIYLKKILLVQMYFRKLQNTGN
jgi:hypothetical protein